MLKDIILLVGLLAWALVSIRLMRSFGGALEISVKKDGNRLLTQLIVGLASSARNDVFRLKQAGAQFPEDADNRLLELISRAKALELKSETAQDIGLAATTQKEIDLLYDETLDFIAQLRGGS